MIQSEIQNGGGSLDFRATQINFEVVLEIQECDEDIGDVNLQLRLLHN
jgi:hypothetical protein